jgi:D-galacturonate reductase
LFRFDPIYEDARNQILNVAKFGHVNYFYAYMSQPKYQLSTFASWIKRQESDISFYLNAHHIDFLCWALDGNAVPTTVFASASKGTASSILECEVDDTITLCVQFKYIDDPLKVFTAIFTSSWVAPNKSEVHSQQRFHCLGSKSEIRVDQAHRGYELTSDDDGYTSKNPLFMNYTPDARGNFVGENAYGYKSFKGKQFIDSSLVFTDACKLVNEKKLSLDKNGNMIFNEDLSQYGRIDSLALIQKSFPVTAILEAGRISLKDGSVVKLNYDDTGNLSVL